MAEHKRRIHYGGKYPKRFEEKYKELNPERYADMAEHILAKGNTPAGTHVPIMVQEILEFLKIQPGQIGLDCTFGYGGHSSKMLEQLQGQGHLTALDADPIESAKSLERLRKLGYGEDLLTVENINFAQVDRVAERHGPFDFVLADLGVSSMQLDNPERGFSYKTDGPLDLRLNPTTGLSAADLLAEIEADDLSALLTENADEPYADAIARTIVSFRKSGKAPETTLQLRAIIERALTMERVPEKDKKELVKKTCARCFQALRIEVNKEYEVLYELLSKLPAAVKPGGRVAILTFHSGEDRLVKQAFKQGLKEGLWSSVATEVIRPSAKECSDNPRAKSTKLRWAVKS
ncbi:MAG: 16S rRNA (cytosine(1402)-N(4))-methyltransferase RsmH [Oscillospiraceae bacterium]|nr:16S rRNA (cytosine(1402)-N(4))-methyltransferase RsmH [Oscillospiraceae bacterium]